MRHWEHLEKEALEREYMHLLKKVSMLVRYGRSDEALEPALKARDIEKKLMEYG